MTPEAARRVACYVSSGVMLGLSIFFLIEALSVWESQIKVRLDACLYIPFFSVLVLCPFLIALFFFRKATKLRP